MLFDSERAKGLLSKFSMLPKWQWPYAYVFATKADFEGERALLEELISKVREPIARRWTAGLLSDSDDRHVATWFEAMLYSWLLDVGPVEIDPNVAGGNPDFKIAIGGIPTFIEAQAFLRKKEQRIEDKRVGQIFYAISQLTHPFMVEIKHLQIAGPLSTTRFTEVVHDWLANRPDDFLLFEDDQGNRIGLQAESSPSASHKTYAMRTVGGNVDPAQLRRPLKKKAGKYKQTRDKYPYIIAIFPEASEYDARDVAAAWFGRE